MQDFNLLQGDCVEQLKTLPDQSVDLVLCDPPYAVTDAVWDKPLQWPEVWEQYARLVKPTGNILLFSSNKFTIDLISTAPRLYRYRLVWVKNIATNFLSAYLQPLRVYEEICVFASDAYINQGNTGRNNELREYFFNERERTGLKSSEIGEIIGSKNMTSHYFTRGKEFNIPTRERYEKLQAATGCFPRSYDEIKEQWDKESNRTIHPCYNPQGVRKMERPIIHKGQKAALYGLSGLPYVQQNTGFPRDVIYFDAAPICNREHPSEKPADLLEYLIKTYSNPGEVVLDNCMGGGSTGEAALNTGRKFIGIEIDAGFFETAKRRIEAAAIQSEGANDEN